MSKASVDGCPVTIFSDGSVRIDANKRYICMDIDDLSVIIRESQRYSDFKDLTTNPDNFARD